MTDTFVRDPIANTRPHDHQQVAAPASFVPRDASCAVDDPNQVAQRVASAFERVLAAAKAAAPQVLLDRYRRELAQRLADCTTDDERERVTRLVSEKLSSAMTGARFEELLDPTEFGFQ
jgi:hypothetical protein